MVAEEAAVEADHNMNLFEVFVYVSAAMFWIGVISFTILVYKTYKKGTSSGKTSSR